MRTALLALLLIACKVDEPVTLLPGADLAGQGADLAWTDLAGGVDIAQYQELDFAVGPDFYPADPWNACPTIPTCSPPAYTCCNHTAHCYMGQCVALTGESCNVSDMTKYRVVCADGKTCGFGDKCE